MKRKSLIVGMLFIVLILLCNGCGLFGSQQYTCLTDNVQSVQIIRLDAFMTEELRYEYTVLCEIEDNKAFLEQVNSLKQSVNWGEPVPLTLYVGEIVVKINYLNGDYDFLHNRAQTFYTDGAIYCGYFFFDKEEFERLISDYLPDE